MSTEKNIPTIRGVFVNSHITKLKEIKGYRALADLEKRYGKSLKFGFLEEVPVREEVIIIELVLDLISDKPIPSSERTFEAGRLHFRNFSGTPLARIMFTLLSKDIKMFMMATPNIGKRVFKNIKFNAIKLGPKTIKIIMDNNDYPLDHFKGFFYE